MKKAVAKKSAKQLRKRINENEPDQVPNQNQLLSPEAQTKPDSDMANGDDAEKKDAEMSQTKR